ncbi:indoleamine 2,3-dioxygenase 2-like isoform X3 [Petromyzon marinus]|uniref:Indoleamine 2,3-dioxygenase 2-like isoform X3 n=1 Tax=Petromyzon marinus TaxID=7757 RepID=A0AAJ7SVL0_PETMA|nr:indoleamine 2,3-dioxygenase 2-like isoform X3 [Petromyzon marinus]
MHEKYEAEVNKILKKFHISKTCGFALPDPLTSLPEYYAPWMELAANLTELIETHTLRERVMQMPELSIGLLQSHRQLRLAHLVLSFITSGVVWQEGDKAPTKVLPRSVAVPFCAVSKCLGLPPIIVHADGVLANWRRRDADGPMTIENLDTLVRLPGGANSRYFFLCTVMVEFAAVPGIIGLVKCVEAVRAADEATLKESLLEVAEAIHGMIKALSTMHGGWTTRCSMGCITKEWETPPTCILGAVQHRALSCTALMRPWALNTIRSMDHSWPECGSTCYHGTANSFAGSPMGPPFEATLFRVPRRPRVRPVRRTTPACPP